eukprot:scaffold13435_cov33-Tisochrysis_lutea.AAC.2
MGCWTSTPAPFDTLKDGSTAEGQPTPTSSESEPGEVQKLVKPVPPPRPATQPLPSTGRAVATGGSPAAGIQPKYMTVGQLKKAIREHGTEPADNAGKEALQAQLCELLGLDSSQFASSSPAKAQPMRQPDDSLAARRAMVEAALLAGPPKRVRGEGGFNQIEMQSHPSLPDRIDDNTADSAIPDFSAPSRPRAASSRRPPSRKPGVAA